MIAEFGEIALGSGRFDVDVQGLERIGALGADRVEFLFAANAGETARPFARVASGGELSRVLLAVVALAQSRMPCESLIFDEIDAGMGVPPRRRWARGSESLRDMGRSSASPIWRRSRRGPSVTTSSIRSNAVAKRRLPCAQLGGSKEREAEIARMLSGETHDVALRHARALLKKQ